MYDYDITASFGNITVKINGNVVDVNRIWSEGQEYVYIRISASLIEVSGSGAFNINNFRIVDYNIYNSTYEVQIYEKINVSSASGFFSLYETDATYDWPAGDPVEWHYCDLNITGTITSLPKYLVQGELGIRQYLRNVNIQCTSIGDASYSDDAALGNLNGNSDIRSLAIQNCSVNIQADYIGDYVLGDSAIHSATLRANNYGSYLFYRSELTIADMDPNMTIGPYTYYLCKNLTQFNSITIDGRQFINYVNLMTLNYNFYGCNNITVFTMGDDLTISYQGNNKEYETYERMPGGYEDHPLINTTIYTDNPAVIDFNRNHVGDEDLNNGFEEYFHRPATLVSIHAGIWYIAHEGQWLVFNPQEVTDNNCIIMKHKGQYIKYKLVLPSDPKASPVYCKHNNRWMCLAYN